MQRNESTQPSRNTRSSRIRTAALAGAALGVVGLCACASADKKKATDEAGLATTTQPADPTAFNPEIAKDRRRVGLLLAELDQKLRTWQGLVISGDRAKDAHKLAVVEKSIAYDAAKHEQDLVDQLLGGPPNNRRIAAAAIGFARSPATLGPLLAALQDSDIEVVTNALLSLGTLRDPATPLASIASLMAEHTDAKVRVNAGRALRTLLPVVNDQSEFGAVRSAAQLALGDPEAPARTNALLLLAELRDTESLDRIALAIDDGVPMVAQAASRSVAFIGSHEPEHKGRAGRVLAAAFVRGANRNIRVTLLQDLQTLSGKNFGNDSDAWLEWANRLP